MTQGIEKNQQAMKILAFLFLLVVVPVLSFSTGSPNACLNSPLHNAAPQPGSTFPYAFDYTYDTPNNRYKVRLTGSTPFKGFLIKAVGGGTSHSWTVPQSEAQIISSAGCPPAVTHTDNKEKNGVEIYLNGPSDAIVFTAVVVIDFTTFWVDRSAQWVNLENW